MPMTTGQRAFCVWNSLNALRTNGQLGTGFSLSPQRVPLSSSKGKTPLVSGCGSASCRAETRAIPGAPDLAVEVLSPGNSDAAVHSKVADYLAAGTTLVWVVDPELSQVLTYRSLLMPGMLSGADLLTADDLLPDFSVPVCELFAL